MALFTDGPLSSMEDLTAQDSQLANVANVEGIDVTQKLALAQEELALEIETLLKGLERAEQALWLKPKATTRNVAATPALKLWHSFRTLEMVYRDAYSNQLNDRYAAKRDQFEARAKWAYEKFLLLGIGIVWSPVGRAMEPPVVSAQGALPDGTYYVAVTWTNEKGEEGAPSIPAAITTSSSSFLVGPMAPPEAVTGWNVYMGTDPAAMVRQNEAALALGAAWLQPDPAIMSGNPPGWGQRPNYMMPAPRMILRG